MPRKLIVTAIAILTSVATIVIVYAQPLRNWRLTHHVDVPASSVNPSAVTTPVSNTASETDGPATRNLALQPEAWKLAKRIGGGRFHSSTAAVVVQGVVKVGGASQQVTIVRGQTVAGERVEVTLGSGPVSLSWASDSGPQRSGGAVLTQDERILLERLTYDGADEFVLAQLRGASYSVVIRNLRPDDAADNYEGPLWDVVRVDDPERDEQKRPLSPWRLYYINRTTGLIDKVVSEIAGERGEAQFSDWTEHNGEKFPAFITWSRSGQTVMTFKLIDVSLASH